MRACSYIYIIKKISLVAPMGDLPSLIRRPFNWGMPQMSRNVIPRINYKMAETILNNFSFPKLFQENVPGQYVNIIFSSAGI